MFRFSPSRLGIGLVATLLGLMLTACGGSESPSTDNTQTRQAFSGRAMGGRQPIVNSTVTVYAASATAGGAPTQIGQATTNAQGQFTIASFSPEPTAGQIVYVVADGGNAGSGTNSKIRLMTVAGAYCTGGSCSFPSTVNVNELSTVASSQALQDYLSFVSCSSITDNSLSGTCVSLATPSGRADSDLATRAKTIGNLVDVSTGDASTFLTSAADGSALNTTWRKLNSLADILANCVNSTGTGSACTDLWAKSNNSSETLAAAHYIAQHSDANPSDIFALLGMPQVFTPTLAAAPANWMVAGKRYVYAANDGGTIRIFSMKDADGALTDISAPLFLPEVDQSVGDIRLSPNGRYLLLVRDVSFDGWTTAYSELKSYAIDPASGALSERFTDSQSPHNGSWGIAIDPTGHYVYKTSANDSTIELYTLNNETGALALIESVANGNGGIGIAITPNGQYAYVANSNSNTIGALGINSTTGTLTPLPAAPSFGNYPTGVAIDPSGQYLYAANQDSASVTAFTISGGGSLALAGMASASTDVTNVCVDATGRFVYATNQSDSAQGNISMFRIEVGGYLTAMGAVNDGNGSMGITSDPSGRFVYATNPAPADESVSHYAIDTATGMLTHIFTHSVQVEEPSNNYPRQVIVSP